MVLGGDVGLDRMLFELRVACIVTLFMELFIFF